MKRVSFLLLFLCFNDTFSQPDPCACQPDVGKIHPYRLDAKWETNGTTFPRSKKTITPSTLFSWEKKYSKSANGSIVAWNTARLTKTPEESIYTMNGWLWFVKAEVDCDFHIQIGKKSRAAHRRAVVEVTIKQCQLQNLILDSLFAQGFTMSQIKKGAELKHSLPVTLEGMGFYDWQHQLKKPSANTPAHSPLWKQQGTAWELHPVITVKFTN